MAVVWTSGKVFEVKFVGNSLSVLFIKKIIDFLVKQTLEVPDNMFQHPFE